MQSEGEMKLPHVLFLPSWYPTERAPLNGFFFREQARALASGGIRTGVVTVEQQSIRTLSVGNAVEQRWQLSEDQSDDVVELRQRGWAMHPKWLARSLWVSQMRSLARQYAQRHGVPDVIHAQSTMWGALAAREVAADLSRPYFVTEHRSNFLQHDWHPDAPAAHRQSLREASGVAAVSHALARRVQAFAPGIECSVLPNVVDAGFFAPVANTPRKPFRILTIGMLTEVKGVDLLIEAFAQALQRANTPDMSLAIGGDGPEALRLKELALQLGVAEKVQFLGMLDRAEVRAEMERASIFALASRRETFGVVLIEAMAAGLPLVATNAGGPSDIVTDDVGLLVPPMNVPALAEALGEMMKCHRHYDRQAISNTAVARYGRSAFVRQLLSFYGFR